MQGALRYCRLLDQALNHMYSGTLPNAEAIYDRVFSVPWFKHDVPSEIEMYANAIKKVVAHASELVTAEAEAEVASE